MSQLRVWIAFGLLCSIWGASYLFIRIGVKEISPLALVALRLTIGSLTMALIVAVRRPDLAVSRGTFAAIAATGTINSALPFLLISWGETTVPSGLASVLNSTTPIFTVLLAGFVLHDEPITLARVGGVLIGFVGVIVLLARDLSGAGLQWSTLAGQGAIILAAFCYAVAAVLVRRTLRGVPSLTIGMYVLIVSAAEVLVISLIFSPPPLTSMSPKVWLAAIWLGMLGSGFAFACAYFILEHWGASRYTLVTYVLPVIGLALGAVFLGEVIDWHIIAGSLLVLLGIGLVTVFQRRGATESGEPAANQAATGSRSASPVAE